MSIVLNLKPDLEKNLTARADERGVSLDDYLQELIDREAGLSSATEQISDRKKYSNLSDLLLDSPFAGANLDLERLKDCPRHVDLG